jgi:hypothetical protein
MILFFYYFFFFDYRGCPGQLARTSTNPTGPEVNDHVAYDIINVIGGGWPELNVCLTCFYEYDSGF